MPQGRRDLRDPCVTHLESMEQRAFELELGTRLSCMLTLSRDRVECSQEGSGLVIIDFKYEYSLSRVTELYTKKYLVRRIYFTLPHLA